MDDEFKIVGKKKGRDIDRQIEHDKLIEDDNEEDESVKYMNRQIEVEDKMENLLCDIKNYTEEQCIEIGDKLNIGYLIDLFYPNLKRIY
jgi:hypothetical protein